MKKSFLTLFIFSLLVHSAFGQTATFWRGAQHAGIFEGNNLLTAWPESGPELAWAVEEIGRGYGSPTIVDDRLYIQGEIEGTGYLFAFDLKGRQIWKKAYGPEWIKTFPGSRACPTVAGNLIYVCSGMGNLACFDRQTGDKKWSADLKADFQGEFTMHGHSEAPAIDGDKIFLTPGGKTHNVVALNRFTGKLIWSCPGVGERPAYNAPNVIRLNNRHVLVTFSAYALMGINAETGELLWTHVQDNLPVEKHRLGMGDTHSNTVYYEDGFLYYVAGDGNCGVKLKLTDDGKAISQVWHNADFDDYMGGFVKLGNVLYGGATAKKRFVAVDASTGSIIGTLRLGSGNTIAADGMIYYYNQRGRVHLIRPNNGQPEVISTFKITKGTQEHFSQPVIDRGVLYVRHGNALMAYKIQG